MNQPSLLTALEPIDPRTLVDRIPGIDAPCICPDGRPGECAPLCGAAEAYGRFVKPWQHEPECPARTTCGWPFCGWKTHLREDT